MAIENSVHDKASINNQVTDGLETVSMFCLIVWKLQQCAILIPLCMPLLRVKLLYRANKRRDVGWEGRPGRQRDNKNLAIAEHRLDDDNYFYSLSCVTNIRAILTPLSVSHGIPQAMSVSLNRIHSGNPQIGIICILPPTQSECFTSGWDKYRFKATCALLLLSLYCVTSTPTETHTEGQGQRDSQHPRPEVQCESNEIE